MNKYFKLYINSIIGLGILALLSAFFILPYDMSNLNLLESFVFSIMMVISGVVALSYSEDKNLSLLSSLIIICVWVLPPPITFVAILVTDICYKLRLLYIDKKGDKFIDVKFVFNFMSKAIIACIMYYLKYVILTQWLYILTASLVYTILNMTSLVWVIRLYSNDLKAQVVSTQMKIHAWYYVVSTSFLMVYAYQAYSGFGVTFVFVFLMSFVTYILKPVTHKEMIDQIYHDPLTGLKSRGLLDKVLFDKLYEHIPFTLLFLDFDDFKGINDTHGHEMGDAVLRDFAEKAKSNFDLVDKMYRFGGDEFCVIVDRDDDLDRNLNQIKEDFQPASFQDISYSVTIGVHRYNGGDKNITDLVAAVSRDMKAKKKDL